jgi:hypothetical protein
MFIRQHHPTGDGRVIPCDEIGILFPELRAREIILRGVRVDECQVPSQPFLSPQTTGTRGGILPHRGRTEPGKDGVSVTIWKWRCSRTEEALKVEMRHIRVPAVPDKADRLPCMM